MHAPIEQNAICELITGGAKGAAKLKNVKSDLAPRGRYIVEHWRGGRRINEYHFQNGVVNEGKNRLLNVMFHSGTQISTWYMGFIDNSGYSALASFGFVVVFWLLGSLVAALRKRR